MTFFEKVNQIELLTFKLIQELKIKKAPIPVEKIINKMGLALVRHNMGNDASGMLVISADKGTIACNSSDNEVRQRFTMAHELGHFILHKSSSELFVDKDFLIKYRNTNNSYTPAELQQESEANAFAAALLMPKQFIEEKLKLKQYQKLQELALIPKLAAEFKVSAPAMTFRLSNLNNNYSI